MEVAIAELPVFSPKLPDAVWAYFGAACIEFTCECIASFPRFGIDEGWFASYADETVEKLLEGAVAF